MDLHLVLLPMIVAASLASTELCASSPGTRLDLSLHSQRNASGHWIITVNTQRSILTENQRELMVNVHQETRLCGSNEIEQLISMTTVYPPVHDSSMSGALEPTPPSTTPMITSTTPVSCPRSDTAKPGPIQSSTSTTTRRTTPSTTATPSTTTTTTTTTRTTPPTTATPTTTTTTATTTFATRPKSCPHAGYQLFPEFNCYKTFPFPSERKSWSDARELCRRDGGDLMVMETEREREDVFIPLRKKMRGSRFQVWVGVHIPQGGDGWMTVKGEPVLSTWWQPGEPEQNPDYTCAGAAATGLLENLHCVFGRQFICEIPL